MSRKLLALAGVALAATTVSTAAEARTQMRAVGSSTVYPFAKQVAERVARANPRLGSPIIESTGTGAGIKLFCAGVGERFPDVANASRRMKASEAKACAANGVTKITEIQVGIDGIALSTSKRTPLAGLTTRDVYLALAKTPFGKPNKAKTWKDVNGKLPALPIRVYGPPPTSGTRDAFGELVMTAGLRHQSGHGRGEEGQRDQVQGHLHRHARRWRVHRSGRERQSDRSEARSEPRHRRHLRLFAISKRMRTC